MLQKSQRIRLESDYKRILRKGRRTYSQFFTIFAVPSTPSLPTRFGFIASKKVGKAVVRNRAKRIVREVIRLNLDKIKDGFDVVVILSPNAADQNFEVLESSVINSLKKAGLLLNN